MASPIKLGAPGVFSLARDRARCRAQGGMTSVSIAISPPAKPRSSPGHPSPWGPHLTPSLLFITGSLSHCTYCRKWPHHPSPHIPLCSTREHRTLAPPGSPETCRVFPGSPLASGPLLQGPLLGLSASSPAPQLSLRHCTQAPIPCLLWVKCLPFYSPAVQPSSNSHSQVHPEHLREPGPGLGPGGPRAAP